MLQSEKGDVWYIYDCCPETNDIVARNLPEECMRSQTKIIGRSGRVSKEEAWECSHSLIEKLDKIRDRNNLTYKIAKRCEDGVVRQSWTKKKRKKEKNFQKKKNL